MLHPRVSWIGRVLCAVSLFLAGGCTSLSTVRSADVIPGLSLAVQASTSTKPGEAIGWFFHDCARCNSAIASGDVGITYGSRRGDEARPFAIGLGVSGIYPYADGYLQLDTGPTPAGVGGRIAYLPRWVQSQLYGRFDIPLGDRTRLLLNPAIFVQTGTSPNHENPGTFLALVQGVGILLEGNYVSLTPAVALVAASGARERESGARVFGTASVAVTVHGPRVPRSTADGRSNGAHPAHRGRRQGGVSPAVTPSPDPPPPPAAPASTSPPMQP